MPIFQHTKRTCDDPPALCGQQRRGDRKTAHRAAKTAPTAAPRHRLLVGLLGLLGLLAIAANAASWNSRLADGRRIQVDPTTNRVTVFPEQGDARQLWDGVHRLQDGSTITIRSGVMVPNKAIVGLRGRLLSPDVAESDAPCQRLVRKVCGLHDECQTHPACGPARQLLQMSQQQAQQTSGNRDPEATQWGLEQCRVALADPAFFASCDKIQRGATLTPCERLLDKVCGPHQECRQQPRCPLAKQMLDMEAGERGAATDPDAATFTSSQCREALADEDFFNPCQP